MCKNFNWSLKCTEFSSDCYVMPLGFCDLLLGVLWFSTLGRITWDFANLTFEFIYNGKKHFLRGKKDHSNLKTVSSLVLNKLELEDCTLAFLQLHDSSNPVTIQQPLNLFSAALTCTPRDLPK